MADIARALGLPESTVRYYRDRFSDFIPTEGEGRTRRYRPEALEVLRFIADAMRSGMSADELNGALARRFPITLPDRSSPQQQDRNLSQQSAAMVAERIADLIANTEKTLLEVAAETATLRNEIAATLAEADLRHQDALRRIHAAQEAQTEELKRWLDERLPAAEAKRLGIVARMKAMLRRDRDRG